MKLVKNLVANPDLFLLYLRTSIFSRKHPIEHGMPWWSFRAIERADELFYGKTVFEFGTGGSTLRYAKVAKSITCVEDDEKWGRLVEGKLMEMGLKNVQIIYQNYDFDNPVNFAESDYLRSFDGRPYYDVVVIDGQDKTFKERITCFKYIERAMKDGGVVIVDDWWRYTELLRSNRAKNVEVYESIGPCRIGVTSTAFFFY